MSARTSDPGVVTWRGKPRAAYRYRADGAIWFRRSGLAYVRAGADVAATWVAL